MKRLAVLTAILASPAMAHTGHDAGLTGVAHYAFSPVHGLGVIALAGVVAFALRRVDRRNGNE